MSATLEWDPSTSLVDLLLDEQQSLSAVDHFSRYHDSATSNVGRYESLIPSSLPKLGEQFAFRVDLDSCTGCKACVTACHSLNGLEEGEAWRTVGLMEGAPTHGGSSDSSCGVHQQTVTSSCHHCEDPACLSGCPVQAYEKDPTTGIVRHLDDQCIGCRYCQLMCPYDVPKYSERLGIVRKCDMCHDRLAVGEAPACVQGCPNEAISIGIVADGRGATNARAQLLEVPSGSIPDSRLTGPTTRYVSSKPNLVRIDPTGLNSPAPSAAHTPLAVMLVLTQAAIGMVTFDALALVVATVLGLEWDSGRPIISLATGIGLVGLASSAAHLGRPQWAFRAILGLWTSWMSREIVILGGFAGVMVGSFLLSWVEWGVDAGVLPVNFAGLAALRPFVHLLVAMTGLLGLYCSIQIYAVTGRPLWRFDRTAFRFVSTTVWVGIAAGYIGLIAGAGPAFPVSYWILLAFALCLMALTLLRLRIEGGWLLRADVPEDVIPLKRSTILLEGELANPLWMRRRLLLLAGVGLPLLQIVCISLRAPFSLQIALAISVVALGVVADLIERSLFFRSEAMPSMPGVE